MAGSKTVAAQEEGQTMEHSRGVMEMFRKVQVSSWWWMAVADDDEDGELFNGGNGWLGGRRIWRMGWRKVEYRGRGMWIRLSVPSCKQKGLVIHCEERNSRIKRKEEGEGGVVTRNVICAFIAVDSLSTTDARDFVKFPFQS